MTQLREDPVFIRFPGTPDDPFPGDGPNEMTGVRPHIPTVDRVVERVADAEGDLCIVFSGRVGATPWVRPTPYRNHRDVVVRMWSCISCYPKAVPGRTMLFGRRSFVWPDEKDDWEINIITREWVWSEVRRSGFVDVMPAEESPWTTDWWDWHWDERDGDRR